MRSGLRDVAWAARRKARWQKSSIAWDAGRCHTRVRSRVVFGEGIISKVELRLPLLYAASPTSHKLGLRPFFLRAFFHLFPTSHAKRSQGTPSGLGHAACEGRGLGGVSEDVAEQRGLAINIGRAGERQGRPRMTARPTSVSQRPFPFFNELAHAHVHTLRIGCC